jgi:hypothetical protein
VENIEEIFKNGLAGILAVTTEPSQEIFLFIYELYNLVVTGKAEVAINLPKCVRLPSPDGGFYSVK